MTTLANPLEPITPTEEERQQATEMSRILAPLIEGDIAMEIVTEDYHSQSMTLPASAQRLFYEILRQMAAGNTVAILPVHAELTTQQAADYLNVSHSYLVKLLDSGEIPSQKSGAHRSVLLDDIAAYKRDFLVKRRIALRELAALSQELDMGY